ncbi:Fatty acid oxidation complex subunit alpha [Candidatus Lokiarchaeum ossiferum]|uniref:Fatty acid oxidation complex subunit alpha n=1 Tax=Candidatus Lokiarchaeum ossiferum TaxID=2951803 RepID=A0ABY6HJV6_9ARCH|nr:Fatty acid oxidation complex subunit alpha [Candidatus Lokiarchaeum sp. B-35]
MKTNLLKNEKILFKIHEKIAYITINTKMNILDMESAKRLTQFLVRADSSEEVNVVVLKSAGDRVFSAGFDLKMFEQGMTEELRKNLSQYGRDISLTLFYMKKPVIAQIQGSAIGMGCIMILASDFRFAAQKESTFFRLPEVDMDMFPITGPTAMAVFSLGQFHAKDMLLTGRKVSLEEFTQWGALTKVCPPEKLDQEVELFAQSLAKKIPFLMNTIKPAINLMAFAQAMNWFDLENELQEFKSTEFDNVKKNIPKKIKEMWNKYGKGLPYIRETL